MTTAIALREQAAPVRATSWTPTAEQERMIRDSFLSGASPAEAAVLLEVAKLRHLNPLTRQIHFVKRWDKQKGREVWSHQVGIDGFRAIAERTGLYDGQDEPEWEHDSSGLPTVCKVRVYRRDWSRPAVGVAHYREYVQTTKDGHPNSMWSRGPHLMLAKCAEAVAMRKAFPEDLSGLYAPEEMGADAPPVERDVTPPAQPTQSRTGEVKAQLSARVATPTASRTVSPEDAARATRARQLWEQAKAGGATPDTYRAFCRDLLGEPKPSSQWTDADMDLISKALEVGEPVPDEPPPPGDADAPPFSDEDLPSSVVATTEPVTTREPGEDDGDEVDMSLTVRVKGADVRIADLEPKSLAWWAKKLREDLADPGKARWSASNASKLRTVEALLST